MSMVILMSIITCISLILLIAIILLLFKMSRPATSTQDMNSYSERTINIGIENINKRAEYVSDMVEKCGGYKSPYEYLSPLIPFKPSEESHEKNIYNEYKHLMKQKINQYRRIDMNVKKHLIKINADNINHEIYSILSEKAKSESRIPNYIYETFKPILPEISATSFDIEDIINILADDYMFGHIKEYERRYKSDITYTFEVVEPGDGERIRIWNIYNANKTILHNNHETVSFATPIHYDPEVHDKIIAEEKEIYFDKVKGLCKKAGILVMDGNDGLYLYKFNPDKSYDEPLAYVYVGIDKWNQINYSSLHFMCCDLEPVAKYIKD